MASSTPKYRVKLGINYPPGKRAEPGDVINDLPPGSEKSLIAIGAIEKVEK